MTIPRPEYPRPQFVRADWLCLNGEWQFEIDPGDSGMERGLLERELQRQDHGAVLPGVAAVGRRQHRLSCTAVWYRRDVHDPGRRGRARHVLLHFQAVDYDATVWVNGRGSRPASRRLHALHLSTCAASPRRARRPPSSCARATRTAPRQPRGKQSTKYAPYSCFYTRTTGIWQTVWMEPVPDVALRRPRLTPDVANGADPPGTAADQQPARPTACAPPLRRPTGVVAEAECRADLDLSPRLDLPIPEDRRRLWSPEDPHLYDIEIELLDARGAGRGPRRQATPGCAASPSTARRSRSTARPSSSGWCSTRATTPTAS